MPNLFDIDDGNGTYDCVTQADLDRWKDEAYENQRVLDKEKLSPEEYDKKYNSIPY